MDTPTVNLNQQLFFDKVRPMFGGKLTPGQVDGMTAIATEWQRRGLKDPRWLAYIYATVRHESAGTMRAIEEYGKGKEYAYGKKFKRGNGPGHRIPYDTPNQLYYGRGLVQITWFENYELMGKRIGKDLLNHPELALDLNIAVQMLFEGMLFGLFTGKKLPDYFNVNTTDWVNARRVINGLDQAEKIAGYAKNFYNALI